ncbi:hypothetical protein TWF696_009346 [Orbilia brochopaga]|uniref:Peroxisomal membrane protein PMP47A n=1 Tax=Orbilia brochopaga TaxID=3140254 RepID=A0AAV9UIV5_9PEZI
MSDNVAHAIAGAGGGIASMVLTYPLITLSTRSQVEARRAETSVLDAVRRIIAREGVAGLYAGLESAMFGISVTNFVYYYWYEWSRGVFESANVRRGLGKKLSTLESMAAGALAGSATVLLTNPIWVVNTRMTARKNDKTEATSDLPTLENPRPKKAPSTLAVLRQLLRDEGFKALFAGVIPALVLVINPILQYTIFEQLKNLLERRRGRKLAPMDAFYLGAVGKLFATGITYPYITVKSRMHVADKADREPSVVRSLKKIVDEEGVSGLYKGIGPKLVQSVITAAFLFAFKDAFYNLTVQARSRAKLSK